ncbi:MAG: hypothetical protein ACOCV2_09000 [Persicimonas sp.]
MKLGYFAVIAVSLVALGACENPGDDSESRETQQESEPEEESEPKEAAEEGASERTEALPPDEWIEERVEQAEKRLSETEEGELVWRSIEAHGGLERWYANGPIYFRFDYRPLGERPPNDTYSLVDTWSSRARQWVADDRDVQFGWDGEKGWLNPPDAETHIKPRFWALTPYYFIAMPFVLADPGTNLEHVGTDEVHGREHDLVKATYEEDVGDSPDDYYIVYLDKETGELGGLRYVVAYPGIVEEGERTPEKLMVYDEFEDFDGVSLATRFDTYAWDEETDERKDLVTEVDMSDVEFRPDISDDDFEVPEGAEVIEEY